MILGIDISTSCTGFALVDKTGKLISSSYCNLSNLEDLFDKAVAVRAEIKKYSTSFDISRISIEENLSIFRRGLSSAHTISTLARFNGIVCYISYVEFGFKPTIISVSDSRKSVGIRTAKKGEDAKAIVREWVLVQEPEYQWPTKTLRNGPRKGEIVFEKGVEDSMDAYVMARACLALKKQ
jgi:hypothetical protein